MDIIRKARGTTIQMKAQRVFFCCDPRNTCSKDSLISDLLSMDAGVDCVVSWLESPCTDASIEQLRNELRDSQLFVIWVTVELLQSLTSGDWPAEYLIARELRVPILPIANDGGLFPRFTELAGAIHGVATTDNEFRTKLKVQLEAFLTAEEMKQRIERTAFLAELFLSYRKIDIAEARNLMKALHDLEGFEAVSIWYDNFLTAGRVFSEEIIESIDKCSAFVLLVTPNLLKKNDEGNDNYVISTEYPYAVRQNKPIVPVEAISTDKTKLSAMLPRVDKTVDMYDPVRLRKSFTEKIDKSTYEYGIDSERAFLLGVAYYKGFGVERDTERAIRLLEAAADNVDASALEASGQLARIYESNYATDTDFDKAVYWRKRTVSLNEELFGKEHYNTAWAYIDLAQTYRKQGDYDEAIKAIFVPTLIFESMYGKDNPNTVMAYLAAAEMYQAKGYNKRALFEYDKYLLAYKNSSVQDPLAVASVYSNMGVAYCLAGDYASALKFLLGALDQYKGILGEEHPDTAGAYINIAAIYAGMGNQKAALENYNQALAFGNTSLGKNHPSIAKAYSGIALIYQSQGIHEKALEMFSKALLIQEKVLGDKHPDTAMTYGCIADVYKANRNYSKALEFALRAYILLEKTYISNHPLVEETFKSMKESFLKNGGKKRDFSKWLENQLK